MTNEDFILQHLDDDTKRLALKKVPDGVDLAWCLQQIEGFQIAKKKLPGWTKPLMQANTTPHSPKGGEGMPWFPPRLSMEQCSSELTAQYKRSVLDRCLNEMGMKIEETCFTDLTGGFGIDFSYMAKGFKHATYVERMPHLCDIARHNFPLLGLEHANIVNGSAEDILNATNTSSPISNAASPLWGGREGGFIFLDPARRDDVGRKVFALEDCTPNLIELQDLLLRHADLIMVKLSPMLDITQALRSVKGVCEVHVVSVQGECKEVLLVMKSIQPPSDSPKGEDCTTDVGTINYHCVNLGTNEDAIECTEEEKCKPAIMFDGTMEGRLLFEPNASILKAGVQDVLCQRYGLQKLHPISNLYIAPPQGVGEGVLPGRTFVIDKVGDFSKAGIKQVLSDLKQANLTIRNFPGTVADLRKRFKLKEGGDVYIFVTTLADGSHAILRCKRPLKGE